ncbi:unnamed protein product [Brachionus calyciflorus]|uniref:Uncharacterized protein n=1 Tax=Brachionus calyciflorus TaxID=104777 RepID=A0A813Z6N8_9BILA|nr:unnamed protein product [Brachionus calyciflorus]
MSDSEKMSQDQELRRYLGDYEKLSDESTEKKRLTFNLAVLYTRLNQPEEAKYYLDKINDDSYIFSNLKDIALLYETLALIFIKQNNNQSNTLKIICECLEQSSIYYSRCKEWSSYCINEIERAKILSDKKYKKESFLIADKVLKKRLYLDESKIETIKILNNLATFYAENSESYINLKTSEKLLTKSINLIKNIPDFNEIIKKETLHLDIDNERLIFIINSNYLSILNQLNVKPDTNLALVKKYVYGNTHSENSIRDSYKNNKNISKNIFNDSNGAIENEKETENSPDDSQKKEAVQETILKITTKNKTKIYKKSIVDLYNINLTTDEQSQEQRYSIIFN